MTVEQEDPEQLTSSHSPVEAELTIPCPTKSQSHQEVCFALIFPVTHSWLFTMMWTQYQNGPA